VFVTSRAYLKVYNSSSYIGDSNALAKPNCFSGAQQP